MTISIFLNYRNKTETNALVPKAVNLGENVSPSLQTYVFESPAAHSTCKWCIWLDSLLFTS